MRFILFKIYDKQKPLLCVLEKCLELIMLSVVRSIIRAVFLVEFTGLKLHSSNFKHMAQHHLYFLDFVVRTISLCDSKNHTSTFA